MPLIAPQPGSGVQMIPLDRIPHHAAKQPAADPVLQAPGAVTSVAPATSANFEGVGNLQNVLPPDTNGDIGRDFYVQIVNTSVAVYRRDGTIAFGPAAISTLWQRFGGPCENQDDGDPIVQYDQLADRWLISQFALFDSDGFHQCIAVSQTNDPTGAWYRYDFLVSTDLMNDYPKFGVWPDAYYMSVNQFNQFENFSGAGAYAFERERMLLGLPAQMVYFDVSQINPRFGSLLPSDLDGLNPPPTGSPNYFASIEDGAWGVVPSDQIEIFQFHVDWSNPANSTFNGPSAIDLTAAGAPFDSNLCNYDRDCIPQPGGTNLDALSDRLMYRLAYRNFGAYESLVLNHSVDVSGTNHAGIRWYEVRNPAGSPPTLFQAGTFAPDGSHRWMGSIAMDSSGDMALGYSVSSTTLDPSIRYTGRLAADAVGTMTQGEGTIIAGGGFQEFDPGRWGDYSMMAVDPLDDCTFWYTNEYYPATSIADWHTRVAAFKFPSCVSPATGVVQGIVTDLATGLPIVNAEIQLNGSTRTTDQNGFYRFDALPLGTFPATASQAAYFSQTVNPVVVANAAITTQDFHLGARPIIQITGTVTDGSGHGWPLYARVGITGGPASPIFTSPTTGAYSFSSLQGIPIDLKVSAVSPGYAPQSLTLTPSGDTTQDFQLAVDAGTCNSPGYHVATAALDETFKDGGVPSGWTVVDYAGSGQVWRFDDPAGRGNNTGGAGSFAIIDSDFYGGSGSQDTALVSPSIDLTSFANAYLHFNSDFEAFDIETADVDLSIDGGTNWTNLSQFSGLSVPGPDHEVIDITSLAAGKSDVKVRFHYYDANFDWWWEVDNVRITANATLGCTPTAGGLVIGAVSDGNSTAALNSAKISSDNAPADTTTSFATPDDAMVPDGFYILFSSLLGPQSFTASHSHYQALSQPATVVADSVVQSDFALMPNPNHPPVANAGPDQVLDGTSNLGGFVDLNGSASGDPDGDPLTFTWTDASNTVISQAPSPHVPLPLGTTVITLTVSDGLGGVSSAMTQATLTDFATSATPSSATVHAGSAVTFNLNATPIYGPYNSPVTFACANLPAKSSCSFSPNTVTPGLTGNSVTLTLQTTATIASAAPTGEESTTTMFAAGLMWLVPGAWFLTISRRSPGRLRGVNLLSGVLLLIVLVFSLSCGGGGENRSNSAQPSIPGTPAGSYTVHVMATAGGLQRTTSVNVTVQ